MCFLWTWFVAELGVSRLLCTKVVNPPVGRRLTRTKRLLLLLSVSLCEDVCSIWLTETLKTFPARCRSCVRREPLLCPQTDSCRLTGQEETVEVRGGGKRLFSCCVCCFHFLIHPHAATPPPSAYGKQCGDVAERPGRTQHSSSAIKTIYDLLSVAHI